MKNRINKHSVAISSILLLFAFSACKKALNEDNFSQLSTDDFLRTESGIKALSISAYSNAQYVAFPMNARIDFAELPTDIMYQAGGGVAGNAAQLYNFTWESTMAWFNGEGWNKPYRAIRDANVLLDNISKAPMTDAKRKV
jgi:starch-binding outer membrane protein, SusD/RagB family